MCMNMYFFFFFYIHDSFTFLFWPREGAAIGSIHVILKQFVSFILMHNLNLSAKLIKAASLQDSRSVCIL